MCFVVYCFHKNSITLFTVTEQVYYIWNQNDGWFIDRYRQAEIVLCTGLGAWEQDGLPSFYKLKEAFDKKQIPAWFAEWGHDVAHDWEWWRKQMPYFLGNLYL
ncbi:esterase [Streptococcus pneumoniae]|nr:esterase [Streptococcus pneumoniae]VNA39957.1 esterase [Streptococcus pneumoniae]VOF60439.1 esterase [Streptococcus pneumoniae]